MARMASSRVSPMRSGNHNVGRRTWIGVVGGSVGVAVCAVLVLGGFVWAVGDENQGPRGTAGGWAFLVGVLLVPTLPFVVGLMSLERAKPEPLRGWFVYCCGVGAAVAAFVGLDLELGARLFWFVALATMGTGLGLGLAAFDERVGGWWTRVACVIVGALAAGYVVGFWTPNMVAAVLFPAAGPLLFAVPDLRVPARRLRAASIS